MSTFFVAGIGIAVFIEFLLVSKKNKTTADRILTVWMLLIVAHLALFYLRTTEYIYGFPFLLGVDQPFPLLQGVFLFLYVSFLTKQLPGNRALLAVHFVPAALMYFYLITFFILPSEQKIDVYRNQGAGYEVFMQIKWYAIAFSGILYVVWSAILLGKHKRNIRDQFSDLEEVNLQWLQILTIGLGVIWLLVIFFQNEALVFSGVVGFVFLIGFLGVRQADIFAHVPTQSDDNQQKQKYQKSGLTEEASEELHRRLKRLMEKEALYKKSDLSITDLSTQLGIHPNYLSQIINQKEKKNFYDFVNTYRIEEFKRLMALQKNRQFTLLSVAHDCGFTSKTSFNRYFKKATGLTPTQYIASMSGSHILPS